MIDHLRDSVEDVAVGVVMTAEVFRNFDKSWITIILGTIYIGYKIYTQHLKAKMLSTQLKAWEDTKTKVEKDIKQQQKNVQTKHKKQSAVDWNQSNID